MTANPSNEDRQFHVFPHLPWELREAIWKASFEPRIVYLKATLLKPGFSVRVWSDKTIDDESFFDWGQTVSFTDLYPPPRKLSFRSQSTVPALYACHESRHVATNVYTLAFGPTYYPCTWFDFKNDTLYVDWINKISEPKDEDDSAGYLPTDLGADLGKVEKLAVCDGLPGSILKENGMDHIDWIRILFRELYSIKTVTVVDRAHDITDSANLVAMDGVYAIDGEFDIFRQMSEFTHKLEEERAELEADYEDTAYYAKFQAYEEATDKLRSNRLDLGKCFKDSCPRVHWRPKPPATKFKVPAIKHTTITTAKKRDTYLEVKRLYNIEKDLCNISIMVRPVSCYNNILSNEALMLSVPGTRTLQEVVQECRRRWKIPFYWQYEKTTSYYEKVPLPISSTLCDLGLISEKTVLMVHFGGSRIQNDGD